MDGVLEKRLYVVKEWRDEFMIDRVKEKHYKELRFIHK